MSKNGYYEVGNYALSDLKNLCERKLNKSDVAFASSVEKNVPIYDMQALEEALKSNDRAALLSEWAWVLREGSGVIALSNAYKDTRIIDRTTKAFRQIIADEAGESKGDHFAASGANDRVWNALQKLCILDPECFAEYYGNASIAAASEAWLGVNYQVTSQVNQVRPGGKAQSAHRDYHLGFQSAELAAKYPKHVHELTAALTLQGAVAHCDMPLESGPTKLLPFSQLYDEGYLAFHDKAHSDYFEENYIQLELKKGDMVFFNPALFHSAGANTSHDILRMANLLQISSAFGRAMEAVNRFEMCLSLYPHLNTMDKAAAHNAIAACAEGYSFPTNLDTDPPIGGNAPKSQADIMREALANGEDLAQLKSELEALQIRQKV